MANSEFENAKKAVSRISTLNEDALYSELGKRLRMNQSDPRTAVNFEPEKEPEFETLGFEQARELGRVFFERVHLQAFNLVCGADAEESKEREQLINAFGIGKEAVASALAAVLVAHLAMAPAVAAVVAVIAIKLFFKPAHGAMCEVWKKNLPDGK